MAPPAADLDASVLNQLLRVKRNQHRAHVCVHPCIIADFPHSRRARNSSLGDVWEWQGFLEAEGVDRNRASVTWTPLTYILIIDDSPVEFYLTACLFYSLWETIKWN